MNSESGYSQFRERLGALIGGEDPFVWAKRRGIPPATFNRMWNEGTMPKAETLAKVVEGTAVSLDWLLLGRGAQTLPAIGRPQRASTTKVDENAFGLALREVPCVEPAVSPAGVAAFTLADDPGRIYVRLPLYAPRVSAGPGLAVQADAPLAALMLFDAEWLWNTLHRPPSQLIVMQAHGDSMSPRIQHNDILIIDTSVDRIKDHGVYCFSYEGDLMVKRLQRSLGTGKLRIVSDNENYPPEELPREEAERIVVIGLVVWHGGIAR
jgi:phage repressor protein C with HTH and peptisase S24 domain